MSPHMWKNVAAWKKGGGKNEQQRELRWKPFLTNVEVRGRPSNREKNAESRSFQRETQGT
ncbi:MAG: hypothetical protein ACKESB_01025 [Candidatus Hodgkinia cicadicola]